MKLKTAFLILVGATCLATAKVCLEVELTKASYALSRREEAFSKLLDHHRYLKYNVLSLTSPRALEKALLARNLELKAPVTVQPLVFAPPSGAVTAAVLNRPGESKVKGWIAGLLGLNQEAVARPVR